MIVDAHAHIYSLDEVTYPPIEKPRRPPAGTGTPEQLRREAEENGVDRVLLVQTATFYARDNRFIRDTAAVSADWAVGVCSLDPHHPHSTDALHGLVARANIKALRTDPAGPDGAYDFPGNRALWSAVREAGIATNAHLTARRAADVARMAREFPEVPVVLDHCLALRAGPDLAPSVQAVIELAQIPNVYAQLSFVPSISQEEYPFRDMHPACLAIKNAFGADRCVWGSGFPTELWCPKTTYAGHFTVFREELGLSKGEQAAILGQTAARIYKL